MYCAYAHSATNLTRGKPFLAEKACTVIAHKHRGGGHLYCHHILCCKSYQGGLIFSLKSCTVIVRKQAPMYAASRQIYNTAVCILMCKTMSVEISRT